MTTADGMLSRADLAHAAGVEPPAVNNWARRHPKEFPMPSHVAGRELYSVAEVAAWLDRRRIPRNALRRDEPAGTTYGQRFRKNLGLPSRSSAETAHRPDAAQAILKEHLWQPLESLWGRAGIGTNLELVLSLLDLRGSDVQRWMQLTTADSGVGALLERALRARAVHSPGLTGVYARIRRELWSDDELTRAIAIIARAGRQGSWPAFGTECFGAATCQFLLEQLAAVQGRRGTEFFTPPSVTRVIMELLDPRPDARICDPCCGSGELLAAAGTRARSRRHSTESAQVLHGYALDQQSWRLAQLTAALHGLPADLGEYPVEPLRLHHQRTTRYDVVAMNPPFNMSGWSDGDPAHRPHWRYGPP
ncbi:HsdM family class I SAM-dependent methyltransferase, partial [Candidatus Protofrankia datiscae]